MINAIVKGFRKDTTTTTLRDRLRVYVETNDSLLKDAKTIDCFGTPVYKCICFDDKANTNYDVLVKNQKQLESGKPFKMYGRLDQNETFWIEDIIL